jgi:RNA polymerase sigma factor (sigma-70 family)
MQGVQETPSELIERHQSRLYGYIRCRVSTDASARDLVQDTWLEVWRRIRTFDPRIGSFWAFTRVWADIVLRRHWARQARPESAAANATDEPTLDGHDDAPMEIQVPDWPVIAGASRSPENSVDVTRVLSALLKHVAECARPPHEIIVFGFSRLEWKPNEIAAELGDVTLGDLEARLEADYAAAACAPPIRELWRPLRDKLANPLRDCIDDPRTQRLYPDLLRRITGQTRLREYFSSDRPPEELLTRWWDSVKRAVFADIRAHDRGQLLEWLEGLMPARPRRESKRVSEVSA